MKVLLKLFQKLAECEAEPRIFGVSFVSFSLRLFPPKKSGKRLKLHLWYTRENPHLCVFPLLPLAKFTLSWRLRTIGEFRPLRRATNAARVGSRSLFEKSDAKTFIALVQRNSPTNQNLKNQSYMITESNIKSRYGIISISAFCIVSVISQVLLRFGARCSAKAQRLPSAQDRPSVPPWQRLLLPLHR